MRGFVDHKRTTGIEDNMLFLFAFKLGSVPNRRTSPLPELGFFSLSSFRGDDITARNLNFLTNRSSRMIRTLL